MRRQALWAGFGLAMACTFSDATSAAPCTTATLDTYLSGGVNASCTVEDKTFGNFTYGSQGILPVAATAVTVTPVLVPNDPGLTFSFSLASTADQLSILGMTYTVTAPATHPISDISIAITGTPVDFAPEDSETGNTTLLVMANALSLSDSADFATPQVSVAVENSALAAFGSTLSSITSRFSEVAAIPEPATPALLALGLGFLAFGRRGKKTRI